jgi:hypothetical protein
VTESRSDVGATVEGGFDGTPPSGPTSGAAAEVQPTGILGTASRDRQWEAWTIAVLLILTIFGAIIRARGFASTGLYMDDAWTALSSRVGLGTAWHMWVTAPGAGVVERTWMILGPRTTWWFQLPDFVCGVAAVPAIFFLARYFKLGRCVALGVTVLVCASLICVEYSTRVKEYPFDFLLSCLLLALAEAARRRPERGPLLAFVVASAGAFFMSASVAVLILGLWAALAIVAVPDRPALRRVLAAAAAAAAVCGTIAAVFYSHISPALTTFWTGYFIQHSSLDTFLTSSVRSATRLLVHLVREPNGVYGISGFGLLLVLVWASLSVVALRRDRSMLGPAIAVLVAFLASAARLAPLGTGRTDEYLYPPLLLLLASGANQLLAELNSALKRMSTAWVGPVAMSALGLVSLLAAGLFIQHVIRQATAYPSVDVPVLATKLHHVEQPGDHVFVNEWAVYPWAYYEDNPLRIEFGSQWLTGFAPVSTDPNVFIAPGDNAGSNRLARWVDDTAAYHRLWYVWTKEGLNLQGFTSSYKELIRGGWVPVRTIHAPGCGATLLVRSADAG